MRDRVDKLKADLMAGTYPDPSLLVGQIETVFSELLVEIDELSEKLRKSHARNKVHQAEITKLRREVAKLNKMKFGANADQKPVSNDTPPQTPPDQSDEQQATSGPKSLPKRDKPSKPRNRNGRGKKNYGENLEPVYVDVITEDKTCPCGCGGTFFDWETKETLMCIPARYYRQVKRYAMYRCRLANDAKGAIVRTKFAPAILPKTTCEHALIAQLITSRFGWYLPWHRLEKMLAAEGVNLVRSTMTRWATAIALKKLRPLFDALAKDIKFNSKRLFMDETTLPILVQGNGKTKTSYLYALHRDDRSFRGNPPPAVVYYHRPGRGMKYIHEILAGVSAVVQTDAYSGYARFGLSGTPVADVTPAKCWAHARRRFTDEFEFNRTSDAAEVINIIEELYSIERDISGKPPNARSAVRRRLSAPVLGRLRERLYQMKPGHLGGCDMGKAINHVLRHWEDLTRFVDNGFIDLDTNPVERMFKPTILLRKNALFIGSEEGGEMWAIYSSLVETCKLNGINVQKYFLWLLDTLAQGAGALNYDKLLPWNAPLECRLKSKK